MPTPSAVSRIKVSHEHVQLERENQLLFSDTSLNSADWRCAVLILTASLSLPRL